MANMTMFRMILMMYSLELLRCMLAVLLFSKLNNVLFGYFDPENIFLDNENK